MISLSTGNPMRVVLQTVLIFEVIVFGLAIPVMILISECTRRSGRGICRWRGAARVARRRAPALSSRLRPRLDRPTRRSRSRILDRDDVRCRGAFRRSVGDVVRDGQAAGLAYGGFPRGRRHP